MLGSFWNHFGIILDLCWDHFGIILGSFWDHLGSFWDHFGIDFLKYFQTLDHPPWRPVCYILHWRVHEVLNVIANQPCLYSSWWSWICGLAASTSESQHSMNSCMYGPKANFYSIRLPPTRIMPSTQPGRALAWSSAPLGPPSAASTRCGRRWQT